MAGGINVSVERTSCGAEFKSLITSGGCVGVKSDGWKGVGVGVEFGAEVMRMKGKPADSGAGTAGLQDDRKSINTILDTRRRDVFINELTAHKITN